MNSKPFFVSLRTDLPYKIRRKIQIFCFFIFGKKAMTHFYFRHLLKYRLNLKEPTTFNEKVCWYKLFYCPNDSLIIKCADKYQVREYLISKGLSSYLPPLIGVWDNTSQIDWDSLPNRFVLKVTNGCGYNFICLDKESTNRQKAFKIINAWKKEKFGRYNIEPHYDLINGRVICEEFINDQDKLPVDYKVHCFNGVPKFIMVCGERTNHGTSFGFFDFKLKDLCFSIEAFDGECKIPQSLLSKMFSISEKIGKDFPFVRVDFYIYKEKLIIGELTFSPTAGYDYTITKEADVEIGKMFDITNLKK